MNYIKVEIKKASNGYCRIFCDKCGASLKTPIELALTSTTLTCPDCNSLLPREKVYYHCPHCDKELFSAYITDELPIPTLCPDCKGEIDPKGAQPYIEK